MIRCDWQLDYLSLHRVWALLTLMSYLSCVWVPVWMWVPYFLETSCQSENKTKHCIRCFNPLLTNPTMVQCDPRPHAGKVIIHFKHNVSICLGNANPCLCVIAFFKSIVGSFCTWPQSKTTNLSKNPSVNGDKRSREICGSRSGMYLDLYF